MIQNAASKKIVVEPYAQESPTTPQHNHGKYFLFTIINKLSWIAQVTKMNASFYLLKKYVINRLNMNVLAAPTYSLVEEGKHQKNQ